MDEYSNKLTDKQFLRRLISCDEEAFEELVKLLTGKLIAVIQVRYSKKQRGNYEDAEEIASDTLVAFHRVLLEGSFNIAGKASPETFINTIAARKIIDHWRKHKRKDRQTTTSHAPSATGEQKEDDSWKQAEYQWYQVRKSDMLKEPSYRIREDDAEAERFEDVELKIEALSSLDPHDQNILELIGDEKSHRAIANILKCSVSTARQRVSRARGRARKKYKQLKIRDENLKK